MHPRLLIEAAAVVTESKVSRLAVEGAEALSAASASTAESGLAKSLRATENGLTPLQKIISSFAEPIPPTQNTATFLQAEKNQIASIIDPERAQLLAIGIQRASASWTPGEFVMLHPRFQGKQILPAVEISAEKTPYLASWGDGRVKMGVDSFPLSNTKTGLAVHEITHHEQGFLIASRKADQLGIPAGKLSEDQLGKMKEVLKSVHQVQRESVTQRFMDFRAGRQLTDEASARADQLIESNQALFTLPAQGFKLTARLNSISHYQGLMENPAKIDKAKTVLAKLQNKDSAEGARIAEAIFGAEKAVLERQALVSKMNPEPAAFWGEGEFLHARTVFEKSLETAQLATGKQKRAWDFVYTNSLHEREARFNQFIAELTLTERSAVIAPNSKHWLPVTLNL